MAKSCYRVAVDSLRVRSKPCVRGEGCTVVGGLRRGDEIAVNGTYNNQGYTWGYIGRGKWCALKKNIGGSYVEQIQCADESVWARQRAVDFAGTVTLRKPDEFFAKADASIIVMRASHGVSVDAHAYRFGYARMRNRALGGYVVVSPYGKFDGKSQVYAGANVFAPLPGDLFVIDVEYTHNIMQVRVDEAAHAALNVCATTGAIPVLYTNAYYWGAIYKGENPSWLSNFHVWIADYESKYYGNPRTGSIPAEFVVMQQYAGNVHGDSVGYPLLSQVDLNLVKRDFLREVTLKRAHRWGARV